MKRRDFMKIGAAAGIVAAFPYWSTKSWAVDSPLLPIPPVLEPDAQGKIALTLQSGTMSWREGSPTKTWGINGPLLGPTLRLKRGASVELQVKNGLNETIALHWHGMEVPGNADGGPQAAIEPAHEWQAKFLVDQRAATCWYHPHTHGRTGFQVAMGLGGLILVEDGESDRLSLPNTWGVDDVPVILQDRKLTPDHQIDYQLDVMTAAVGWFGDLMLTNGVIYPQHKAPRGWLRLRFLNACNARSVILAASDKRPLYVIASDGGFLQNPVKVSELPIFTGERFEVLVEVSDENPFDIVTLPVVQMGMSLPPFDEALPVLRIRGLAEKSKKRMPDRLVSMPGIPSLNGLQRRELKLTMDSQLDMQGMQALMQRYGEKAMAGMSMAGHGTMNMGQMQNDNMGGHAGMHGGGAMSHASGLDLHAANRINDQAFAMGTPMFNVKQGQYERWTISGEGDMMRHPFHIHGAQFRILSENGRPPAVHRSGWKDTVLVENARSEVLIRFAHPAPPERAYMAHCHLLEHEDTGMMMSFTVGK